MRKKLTIEEVKARYINRIKDLKTYYQERIRYQRDLRRDRIKYLENKVNSLRKELIEEKANSELLYRRWINAIRKPDSERIKIMDAQNMAAETERESFNER